MDNDTQLSRTNNTLKHNLTFLKKMVELQSCLLEADFNLDAFMVLITEEIHSFTPATGVVVELVEKDEMVYRAASDTVKKFVGLRLKVENSISGLCIQTNTILRSDDTEHDPRVNLEACRKVKARSLIVAPLIHRGNPVGVIKIVSNQPNGFEEKDMHLLQIMGGFIAAGLAHQIFYDENKKLLRERTHALNQLRVAQKHLQHIAEHDYLTDLANRNLFTKQFDALIEKAKRHQFDFAVLYLDIDYFKTINDTYGHDVGDALLKAFSERLKQCLRAYDIAARLGGDEFAVLLEDVANQADAISVAKKINATIREPFMLNNIKVNVTTSIGITFYEENNHATQAELMKQADTALYHAKHKGRDTYHIFNT